LFTDIPKLLFQLDELGFAKRSPVRRTVKNQHRPFGAKNTLEVLALAVLIRRLKHRHGSANFRAGLIACCAEETAQAEKKIRAGSRRAPSRVNRNPQRGGLAAWRNGLATAFFTFIDDLLSDRILVHPAKPQPGIPCCDGLRVNPTIQAFTGKHLGQEGIVLEPRFGCARLVAGVKLKQYEAHPKP